MHLSSLLIEKLVYYEENFYSIWMYDFV